MYVCMYIQDIASFSWNKAVLRKLCRLFFLWMWSGKLQLNGKQYENWSQVRKEFRNEVIRGHVYQLQSIMGVGAGAATGSEVFFAFL